MKKRPTRSFLRKPFTHRSPILDILETRHSFQSVTAPKRHLSGRPDSVSGFTVAVSSLSYHISGTAGLPHLEHYCDSAPGRTRASPFTVTFGLPSTAPCIWEKELRTAACLDQLVALIHLYLMNLAVCLFHALLDAFCFLLAKSHSAGLRERGVRAVIPLSPSRRAPLSEG